MKRILVEETTNIKIKRDNKKISLVNPSRTISLNNNKRGEKGEKGDPGVDGKINEIIAGPGIIIDNTDVSKPIISATGGSGDKNYTMNFTMQSQLTINHSLQKYPSATIINSAGDEVEGNINYIDINNMQISFTSPFSGRVTLN